MESTCFEIISSVGAAKSCYINAIEQAKNGDASEAQKLMFDGDEAYKIGHDIHLGLLKRTAEGDGPEFNLLLLHAEDQMASAEAFKVVAADFMDVYQKLNKIMDD